MTRVRMISSERRRQILSVATELFAQRGYRGTTTRRVAERAAVNEALLFRHFHSKENLYWAVLEEKRRSTGGAERLRQRLSEERDDLSKFAEIAEDILQRNFDDPTLARLLFFSALERHELSRRFFETYAAEYHELLAAYVRRRIRDGSLRSVDALTASRAFLGMVFQYYVNQDLLQRKRTSRAERSRVCREFAALWLHGMSKSPRPPRERRPARPALERGSR
jgi:AcrR family transcriptional regulator